MDKLEKIIAYDFKDKGLLAQSLTHSSYVALNKNKRSDVKCYQRMEFLGDRVLGLVIAEYLLHTFPNEHEGDLNLRFAQLVRKEACSLVAQNLGLNQFIMLGRNEANTKLNENPTILGDVCEALIAALFLDGGLNIAKAFILKNWQAQINDTQPNKQDAKSALQEWAQNLRLNLPEYKLINTTGPAHAPEFTIDVIVDNRPPARAIGHSKRIVEQKAATLFLKRESIWN